MLVPRPPGSAAPQGLGWGPGCVVTAKEEPAGPPTLGPHLRGPLQPPACLVKSAGGSLSGDTFMGEIPGAFLLYRFNTGISTQ